MNARCAPNVASPLGALAGARLTPLLLLGALAGCAAPTAEFRPLEGAREGPPTVAGAYYDLTIDDEQLGDAKVWSDGAGPLAANDEETEVIHVGIRIRNNSDVPLRISLAQTELEVHTQGGRTLVEREPFFSQGVEPVAPGEIGRAELWFPVPRRVGIDDIAGIELNWAVTSPRGTITRSTPFRRDDRRPGRTHYRPYAPYYHDPFYPRWSWHLGFHHRFPVW